MTQARGLGRGLSALIPGAADETGLLEVPIAAVQPNPRQPRGRFDEESLAGLARSIQEVGVLQPIVVRLLPDGGYELIAGERRLRAARVAGLATIPAIVRDTDDTDSLREALIENLQREDLGPLEIAAAFEELLDDLGITNEALAARLGFSRAHIANTIRLLQLPPAVQRLLAERRISAGHARALLALPNEEAQESLALRIAAEGLSVRQTEALVKAYAGARPRRTRSRPTAGRFAEVEEALTDALGTKVRVQMGKRKGRIVIDFAPDDLDRIVKRIGPGAK